MRPQRRQLVQLQSNAGFSPGNTYAILLPEPQRQVNPDWTDRPIMRQDPRPPPTVSLEDAPL